VGLAGLADTDDHEVVSLAGLFARGHLSHHPLDDLSRCPRARQVLAHTLGARARRVGRRIPRGAGRCPWDRRHPGEPRQRVPAEDRGRRPPLRSGAGLACPRRGRSGSPKRPARTFRVLRPQLTRRPVCVRARYRRTRFNTERGDPHRRRRDLPHGRLEQWSRARQMRNISDCHDWRGELTQDHAPSAIWPESAPAIGIRILMASARSIPVGRAT
jgi:hypothetical protein